MADTRTPAEVFPPGDFIREELEARGWSQVDLANVLGWSLQTVNQIVGGTTQIAAKTAKELAAAFGTSAEFWINLEAAYQLARAEDPDPGISKRAAELVRA